MIIFIISVQDTSMGIKEEDIGRLFGVFQRLDESKTGTLKAPDWA